MTMTKSGKNPEHRYIADLRRLDLSQSKVHQLNSSLVPIGLAMLFLMFVAIFVGQSFGIDREGSLLMIGAATFGIATVSMNLSAASVSWSGAVEEPQCTVPERNSLVDSMLCA